MMKIKPATTWGKIMLIVYALAIAFSITALLITIYLLNTWSFVFETDELTSFLFQSYGFYGGGLLQVFSSLVSMLAIPVLMLILVKVFLKGKDDSFLFKFIYFFDIAIIEGFAIAEISIKFLIMSNDLLVLYFLLNSDLFSVLNLEWLRALVNSIGAPIFLFTLFLSLSVRNVVFFRSHRVERKT